MSTLEDGFGNAWDSKCPTCGEESMSLVRPGKVQCDSEKCYYKYQFFDWLHGHGCSLEELWKIQNCLGDCLGLEHPLYLAAVEAWREKQDETI